MFFLLCFAVLSGVFAYLLKKQFSVCRTILLALTLLLLAVQIVNVTTEHRKITPPEAVLETIASVAWDNENELLDLGFEKHEDGQFVAHHDGEEFLCTVTVTKSAPQTDLPSYKGTYYQAKEYRRGILDYRRLLHPATVTRRYFFYADGMELNILEDNVEKRPSAFEEFILSLK